MRLLVDANLSVRIAERLRKASHEASHVIDHGLLQADDDVIMAFAAQESAVVISADSDFATMLAPTGAPTPSLVLLRSADRLAPDEQSALLIANFETFEAELASGAIVSLSRDHLRVRPLPIVQHPRR